MVLVVKNPPANAGDIRDVALIPGSEEKMATHSGILAWRIPWTEEAGRLQSYTVTNNQTQLKQLSMQVLLLLLSLQSCPTLCNPTDGSPPGSTTPGILQAGTLERVAISFSNAWKWKVKSLSCVLLFATPWTAAYQAPLSMGFTRQEYWSGVPMQVLPKISMWPRLYLSGSSHLTLTPGISRGKNKS